MKISCGICGRFMGEITIEGKLRKGYESLSVYIECDTCHISEGNPGAHAAGDDDVVENLLNLFGMKKP